MSHNQQNDDAKLDAFLRGHKPTVPAAPADELGLLLKAIQPGQPAKRKTFFRWAPVWASAFALVVLAAAWVLSPTDDIRVDNLDTASFALAALTYSAVDDADDFVLRDHPLSGLAEDEGDE